MQQVSCLCLLDLSAAFDTLDHSILLHRLSTCFSIFSVSLQWLTSYLSSRTSTAGIPPHSSHSFPLTCGVPQGSVLGPVLFNLYTTPLSYLISTSSISHLLYADDTQLFTSFVSTNFSSVMNNLQSTIILISSWMSSNYLTLNPSKTEFLLIGLPQQTSKIVSRGGIVTSHYFSTMNIERNVKDTKFDVVSLVTSHYFSTMNIGRNVKDTKFDVVSLVISHYFWTMNIGRNVKDTKFDVVSLVISHYFSKMAANLHILEKSH